jgi:hypothetical protein
MLEKITSKKNIRLVTIFAGSIAILLVTALSFSQFKIFQNLDKNQETKNEYKYPESYITVNVEKFDTNTVQIFLLPSIVDKEIKINAVELDIKALGDKYIELVPTNQRLTLGDNFAKSDWTFPILTVKNIETGEAEINIAGYFSNEEGFVLREPTLLASFKVEKLPETELFISEFNRDNTHFFTEELTSQVPFAIK